MTALLTLLAWASLAAAPVAPSYDAGMAARKRGDYQEALRIFKQLTRENPKSGGGWEGLALTDLALERYQDALDAVGEWEKHLGKTDYAESFAKQAREGLAKQAAKTAAPPAPKTAAPPAPKAPPVSAPPVSLYSLGMEQRNAGDYAAANDTFARLLAQDPSSGGALEGLTLANMGAGRYDEALGFAQRWESQGDSAYIESLKARLLGKLGRREEQARAYERELALDPSDVRAGRRLDALLRSDANGVFPAAGLSKTISVEGLGTPSVNRIVYEGRYGGANARYVVAPGFNVTGGANVTQTAQRNDTHGFTYFDILEQVYSGGVEMRRRHEWAMAQYGQSVLSDNKGSGIGRLNFSRVKAQGGFDRGDFELRAYAERAPYYLRGAGGTNYFALLREDSARVELEKRFLGVGWLARAGIWDYSGNVTANSESLTATKEGGRYLVAASAARGYQEFFGAGTDGRYAFMPFDRLSAHGQYGVDGEYLVTLSYGHSAFRDGNRENDASAGARWWIPKTGDAGYVWLSYHFDIDEFLESPPSYRDSDTRAHWAGVFWKRQFSKGPWLRVGYEHGWLNDSRGEYEGNQWTAELEWYRRRAFSLTSQGRVANTSVGNKSHAVDIQARWTF